jgi:excisionase family DNA binding protein
VDATTPSSPSPQATPEAGLQKVWNRLSRADFARFRNAALGGKAFGFERELLDTVAGSVPGVTQVFLIPDEFRISAVTRLLTHPPLTQWIHCDPGVPAFGRATHELVHRKSPRGRVLYAADDPYVLLHAQSLLEVDERVRVITANICRPREILEHEDARGFLDWGQPIGLVYGDAWIHYPGTAAQATDIMQRWVEQLVNGSYTISSHLQEPESGPAVVRAGRLHKLLKDSPIDTVWFRTLSEIRALYPGQRILPPGLGNEYSLTHSRIRGDFYDSALLPWIMHGIGLVTGSVPPTSRPGAVGIAEAAQLLGLSESVVYELISAGTLPATRGPRRRWELQPDELVEIRETWMRMQERGLTPPARPQRRQTEPTADG